MKKKVVFYGNCHTGAVIKNLRTCKEFNENYYIYPVEEIQNVKDPSYFDSPFFSDCDVLIHQSIWEKNRYGKEFASSNVISKVKKDCQVIAMPNLYHLPTCLFPQLYDAPELRYKERTYFFRDKIIDQGIIAGMTLKEIADKYYDYRFGAEKIRENYYKFLDVVEKREAEWDIKVKSFIDENIAQKALFYEPNHPTNVLIRYYTQELIKILFGRNITVPMVNDAEMDTYQMPMLTEVKDALGLSYSSKDMEIRKTGTKIISVPMDIRQYVDQYFASIWMSKDFANKYRIESRAKYYYLRMKSKKKNFIKLLSHSK